MLPFFPYYFRPFDDNRLIYPLLYQVTVGFDKVLKCCIIQDHSWAKVWPFFKWLKRNMMFIEYFLHSLMFTPFLIQDKVLERYALFVLASTSFILIPFHLWNNRSFTRGQRRQKIPINLIWLAFSLPWLSWYFPLAFFLCSMICLTEFQSLRQITAHWLPCVVTHITFPFE